MLADLITDEQVIALEEMVSSLVQDVVRGPEPVRLAQLIVNAAMLRLISPALREDAQRFDEAVRLARRLIVSGTCFGIEAELTDLVTVLIGLG